MHLCVLLEILVQTIDMIYVALTCNGGHSQRDRKSGSLLEGGLDIFELDFLFR